MYENSLIKYAIYGTFDLKPYHIGIQFIYAMRVDGSYHPTQPPIAHKGLSAISSSFHLNVPATLVLNIIS